MEKEKKRGHLILFFTLLPNQGEQLVWGVLMEE